MTTQETLYVVRDMGGEYLTAEGGRTPCGESAAEFETYEEAELACDRGSDRVYARTEGEWDRVVSGPVAAE